MEHIEIILRKHNYSIMKIKKDMYYVIKNEHGTYGEFSDFTLEMQINPTLNIVTNWTINDISVDENILNILSKCPVSLTQFCKELITL